MRCSSSVRPLRVHEPCPRLIARIRSLWIWASKSPPRISTPAQLVRRSKAGKGVAASQRGCRPCEREPTHGANVTQVHIWGRINGEFLGGRRQAYSPGRRGCAPQSSNREPHSGGRKVFGPQGGRRAGGAWGAWAPAVESRLVLLDVVLPGEDGVWLCNEIGTRWPSLPILFMSAYPAEVLAARGQTDLTAPFLGKPCTRDELVTKIRVVPERRRGAGAIWLRFVRYVGSPTSPLACPLVDHCARHGRFIGARRLAKGQVGVAPASCIATASHAIDRSLQRRFARSPRA